MEFVVGWTDKPIEKLKSDSWASRKADLDLEAKLNRLQCEKKINLRQIDAELNRIRSRSMRKGAKLDDDNCWDDDTNNLIKNGFKGINKTSNSFNNWNHSDTQENLFEDSNNSLSGSLTSMKSMSKSGNSNRSLTSQTSTLSREETSNLQSEVLNKLLITNGEIDLNKVLLLHLLAVSPPCVSSQGPPQAALTTSVTRYANVLPSYLLSPKMICRCRGGKCKCNDIKPHEITVSVNTQIEMIMMTTIQVLARLSKPKLHFLIALAHNPKFLMSLMSEEASKRQSSVIQETGIMNSSNYINNYICNVVKANAKSMSMYKEKKSIVFKMLLPHHYPVFQIPVFSMRASGGALMGDGDESVPVLLNLYKQVTLGKPINDEDSGLSVLPDFCNTRLAIISDDGSDFALISKSGNVVKPTSLSLAENLAALVRSTSKIDEIKKEAEDPMGSNFNPRPKFSKNPAVMMESLIGLAKENLGMSVKTLRTQMGISEVQRRRMESEQLRCSILRRLSNTERMAIARESALRTQGQREMIRKSENFKLENFATLMASCMSKRSIMALARNCSKKERDFMFKPIKKGGLGFGDLILKGNLLSQIESQDSKKETKQSSVESLPSILNAKSQSVQLETDRVRNDIVGAELKEKVRHFVGNDILKRYVDPRAPLNTQDKSDDDSSDLPSRSSSSF